MSSQRSSQPGLGAVRESCPQGRTFELRPGQETLPIGGGGASLGWQEAWMAGPRGVGVGWGGRDRGQIQVSHELDTQDFNLKTKRSVEGY